ncbi:uncharacterized protein LOC133837735 [Drosophila sulfurigaster albostrigata]|uniref:uncharacterized protein LOC133837735 n=1 Tax=Drosophila sulfurigaster albostrigata TaxID=89887 RepID=UPI002D21CF33|nr:uncharacterized protein LOC133837735 [Drosophila sulfurigaster albostrigata]
MQIGFSLSLHFVQILIIFSQTSQSKRIVAEVNGVLGYIHDVDEIITKVQSDIDELDKDSGEFDNATMRENLLKVLQHFKIISIQVEQVEKQYTNITIQQFLYTEIFDNYNDEEDLGNLRHEINNINENFKEMSTIENSNNSNTFIISFAELIDRRRNGKCITPNDFYLELFDLWFRSKKILTKMRHEYQIHVYSFCYSPQSPQQIVFSIYKHIGLTELKAYILIEYSLLLRRIDGQRDLMEETNKVRAKYKNMIENSLNLLEETMQKADRDMWRCDPHELHYNVTYDEVTRLLQGFIVNEVDLNSDGSCSESCSDYQNTTTKGCFKQKFCSQQPKCEG